MRRLSAFLIILLTSLAITSSAYAQDDYDDEEDSVRSAVLTFYLLPNNKTNISFYSPVEVAKLDGLKEALAASFHCDASAFHAPESPTYEIKDPAQRERYRRAQERLARSQLSAECPTRASIAGLQGSLNIGLDPLLKVLRGHEFEYLSVTVPSPHLSNLQIKGSHETAGSYGLHYFEIPLADEHASIALSWGFRRSDLIMPLAVAGAFILIPCSLLLWMRFRALRLQTSDRAGAWFSYMRTQNLCVTGIFLLWIGGGFTVRNQLSEIASAVFGSSTLLPGLLSMAYVYLPPIVVMLVATFASYRVLVEVRQVEWSFHDYVKLQLSQFGMIMIPVLGIYGAIQSIPSFPRASLLVILLSGAAVFVAAHTRRKLTGTYPEPIHSGEFHDRVFLLARRAGVTLRQIFLLPSGKLPMANAFATANGTVMVTDYVLQKLNRREVEAVTAHEIGHLQYKHPRKLAVAFLSVILVPLFARTLLPTSSILVSTLLKTGPKFTESSFARNTDFVAPLVDIVVAALCLLCAYGLSRRYEHIADARSVTLTDDPEALITAFAKLSLINLTPMQWGRTSGALTTHPSTLRRVRRIAQVGNVTEERLQQLLENPDATQSGQIEPELFESPKASSEYVYPAREQLQKATANLLILVLISTGVPTVFAYLSATIRLTTGQETILLLSGLVLTFAVYLIALRWRIATGKAALHRRFAERLQAHYPKLDLSRAQMVGYSPEPWPRYYYVQSHWDTGLLVPVREGLMFLGDQTKFLLPYSSIRELVFANGMPSWWKFRRSYLRWEHGETRGSMNLLGLDYQSPWSIASALRKLHESLEAWRAHPEELPPASSDCLELGLPVTAVVRGKTPREAYPLQAAMKLVFVALIAGTLIAGQTMHLFASFYVPAVVLVLRLIESLPYRRYKDRPLSPEWMPTRPVENRAATHSTI